MDVLDADELELNVGIVVFIFVAFSCSSVCDCIQLERHLIHCQNILFQEENNKKTWIYTNISYIKLIWIQQAHSQDVFKAFAVTIQLVKHSMENKAHLNIQHCTVRLVFLQAVPWAQRAHLRPSVHHIHEVAAGVGPQDSLQHLFVLQAASAET